MATTHFINQVVSVFKNDNEFTAQLLVDGFSLVNDIYPLYDSEYVDLAEIMLENNDDIMASTARDLSDSDYKKDALRQSMGFGLHGRLADFPSDKTLFLQTFYTYKYSAVKIFFRKNYKKFLPEYDVYEMQDDIKKQLLFESFMREFDRFTKIIDNLYNIVDINKVPEEYLNYLAQIIGYEREDYLLLTDSTFRELLKNIIEIYRIKGTNYSFELFLNFLGFDATIQEFWFDKRYADDGVFLNAYTTSSTKNVSDFYLTPLKPTDYMLSGMNDPYYVTEDMISETFDLNQFDKWVELNIGDSTKGYTHRQLLGLDYGYSGTPYEFFKTNVMQYSLTSLGTEQEPELTSNDSAIIDHYVEFLTPLFIEKKVVVITRPYSQRAYDLLFMDYKRSIPQGGTDYIKLSGFQIHSINPGDWGDTSGDSRTSATVQVNDSANTLYNYLLKNEVRYVTLHTGDANDGTFRIKFDYDGSINNYVEKEVTRTKITLQRPLPGGDTVDSGDSITVGKWESMFHMYQGYYPVSGRFWISPANGDTSFWLYGDSFMTYADCGDSNPSAGYGDTYPMADTQSYVPNTPLKYSGHWISGFHTDTYEVVYNKNNPDSVYNYLKNKHGDTRNDTEILDEISSLISNRTLFSYYSLYGVRDRDLIPPLRDTQQIGDTYPISSDFAKGRFPIYGMGFSYNPNTAERLSEGYRGQYGDTAVRGQILKVDKEIGDSMSKIWVDDSTHRFRLLQGDTGDSQNDYIQVFDMPYARKNQNGIYEVYDVFITGDTGDTTVITLGDTLGDIDGDTGGFIQVYLDDGKWQYGDSVYFMYNRIDDLESWQDFALWASGDSFANADDSGVISIGDSSFIVAFVNNDDGDKGVVRLGAFYGDTSGDSYTWKIGNLIFDSSNLNRLSLDSLGDSLFVIGYTNGNSLVKVGKSTGDSIVWPTNGDTFYGDSSGCVHVEKMYGDSMFVVSYKNASSHGMIRIGQFTGGSVSWLTLGDTFDTSVDYVSSSAFDDGRFIIGYAGDSNYPKIRGGKYIGDSHISWITDSIIVRNVDSSYNITETLRNPCAIFSYSDNTNSKGLLDIVSFSGDSLVVLQSQYIGDTLVKDIDLAKKTDTSFLVGYNDVNISNKAVVKFGKFSRTGYFEWSSGDTHIYYTSNQERNSIAVENGDSRAVAIYKQVSDYERLSIFQIPKL